MPSLPLKRPAIDLTEEASSDGDSNPPDSSSSHPEQEQEEGRSSDECGAHIENCEGEVQERASWAAPLCDIVTVHFMSPLSGRIESVMSFHPEFVDSLYSHESILRGFREPKIDIYFCARTLAPCITSSFTERAPVATLADPAGPLIEFYTENAKFDEKNLLSDDDPDTLNVLLAKKEFDSKVIDLTADLPPGQIVAEFRLPRPPEDLSKFINSRAGEIQSELKYEIRYTSFEDPVARDLYRRMAILSPLMIDGGIRLEPFDERWQLLCAYALVPSSDEGAEMQRTFAGMISYCRMFVYPGNYRHRIGQVFVLPAFRGQSLASRMYQKVMEMAENDSSVIGVSVDDPSPAFETISELCNLHRMHTLCQTHIGTGNVPIIETIRSQCVKESRDDSTHPSVLIELQKLGTSVMRLEQKQAERLSELYIFHQLFVNESGEYVRPTKQDLKSLPSWFEEFVKKRIYNVNREALHTEHFDPKIHATRQKRLSPDGRKLLADQYKTIVETHHPASLDLYEKFLSRIDF